MVLSDDENERIYFARLVVGSISFLGSIFVICIYILFKPLQSFLMRQVIYMILIDALRSVSLMLPDDEQPYCYMQAVTLEYTTVSGVLWAFLISLALYNGVSDSRSKIENKEICFLLTGFVLPVIPTLIPIYFEAYKNTGGWCWVFLQDSLSTFLLRLLSFYGPFVVLNILCVVYYCKIIRFLSKSLRGITENSEDKRALKKLIVYPSIHLICYLPALIMRVLDYFEVETDEVKLYAIVISGLSGFFNAIIYGSTDKVKASLRKCCNCKKKSEESSLHRSLENSEEFSS